ncbi:MAG: 23S rRNA (guanosine(2251)-2'-O)-methyltransferase RlmB [Anaerolineales bacterium]|nr:MAG: 23S rRNA (guanosine(2251)-2'-O)-methyltransferase RlmB [Anaerolineales bacterium]
MQELIYGRNPVIEALRANRRSFRALQIQQGQELRGVLKEILSYAERLKIPVESLSHKELDARSHHHQGVVLLAGPYPYVNLTDILAHAQARAEAPLLLLLDQLQDPQNFGTLLRTAEAVGVHGVLLPARQSVSVTAAVVSASSGASEHLLIAQTNLAQAIRTLKDQEIWLVGLEHAETSQRIDAVELSGPVGLVVGSEGGGLRPLVRKSCDFLVSIPMRGRIESLNAAVAGSLVLYRIWEQRGFR